MSRKITIGLISMTLLIGLFGTGAVHYASAQSTQNMSLSQLVELLISIGVIAPDKAVAARSAVSSSNQTTTANTDTFGTTTNAVFSIVSKSIITQGYPQYTGVSTDISTSTLTARFDIKVKAVGGRVIMNPITLGSAFKFERYVNGVKVSPDTVTPSTDYSIPTGVSMSGFNGAFAINENQEVIIPVAYSIRGRFPNGSPINPSGLTSIGIESITWKTIDGVVRVNTSMSGNPDWRTTIVAFDGYGSVTPPTTNQYHSADINKDWKIDDSELKNFTTLYNYRSGTVRTGEYYASQTTPEYGYYVYLPGSNISGHAGPTHSADTDKNWKISLLEFTRVQELSRAGGYKIKAPNTYSEDGFAPITSVPPPVQPSITVLSPNGREEWKQGEYKTISWGSNPQSNYYKIEIWGAGTTLGSSNGIPVPVNGDTWRIVESVSGTSYSWKVGDVDCGGPCTGPVAGGKYRIIVRGKTDISGSSSSYNSFGWSDSYFTITAPQTISQYHSADINKDWKIDTAELNEFTALYNYYSGTTRTGEYSLSVSAPFVPGPGLRDSALGTYHSADTDKNWKISLLEFTRVQELSRAGGYKIKAPNTYSEDGFAPITAPPSIPFISVYSPNGGETYSVGQTVPISWNASNLPAGTSVSLQLSYFQIGQTFEDVIASNLSNTGSYSWTIPQKYYSYCAPGALCGNQIATNAFKMRAILSGPNIPGTNPPQDYSDNNFTITSSTTAIQSRSLVCGSKGDLNGDGTISNADYDLLGQVVVGSINSTLEKADINGDGNISPSDWTLLGRYVKGLDNTFAGCTQTQTNTLPAVAPTPAPTLAPTSAAAPTSAPATTAPTTPAITVISPNGRETIQIGSNYTIRWSAQALPAGEYLHVMIADSAGNDSSYIKPWLPATATEYTWTVADTYPTMVGGNWKISVKTSSGSVRDVSDSTFTVSAPTSLNYKQSNSALMYISMDQILRLFNAFR